MLAPKLGSIKKRSSHGVPQFCVDGREGKAIHPDFVGADFQNNCECPYDAERSPIRASSSKKPRHRELTLIRVAGMNRNIFYIIGVIVVIIIVLKLLGVF
jgi:hypothetical protein